ncbi:hypothetical protein [Photobacterium nomapromontoriensis]|uniref:hypothetical protein n=1 Tax=Photobacterium nomapromontoriensis TaxID=2910237 RepID=UPI003D0F553E
MNQPFVTNQFIQFYKREMEINQAIAYGYGLLVRLDEVIAQLEPEIGHFGVEVTLNYPLIRHALTRCLSFLDHTDTTLTGQDFDVFAGYLLAELRDLERIIDTEFREYDLNYVNSESG